MASNIKDYSDSYSLKGSFIGTISDKIGTYHSIFYTSHEALGVLKCNEKGNSSIGPPWSIKDSLQLIINSNHTKLPMLSWQLVSSVSL